MFQRQFKATGYLRTVSCTGFTFFTIRAKTTVAKCDLGPISNNTTVAHALLQKFYLKQQIEVSLTFLTAHTNLGKFTVARFLPRNLQVKQ